MDNDFFGQGRYFHDDGTEYFPNLHPKPQLCLSCKRKDDPSEIVYCNLNRLDQMDEPEFKCHAYVNAYEKE